MLKLLNIFLDQYFTSLPSQPSFALPKMTVPDFSQFKACQMTKTSSMKTRQEDENTIQRPSSPTIVSAICKTLEWNIASEVETLVSTEDCSRDRQYQHRLLKGNQLLKIFINGTLHELRPFEKVTKDGKWKRSKCSMRHCKKGTFYYCHSCYETKKTARVNKILKKKSDVPLQPLNHFKDSPSDVTPVCRVCAPYHV